MNLEADLRAFWEKHQRRLEEAKRELKEEMEAREKERQEREKRFWEQGKQPPGNVLEWPDKESANGE